MSLRHRRLWSAVLLQAYRDLGEMPGSRIHNEAAAWFFSAGRDAQADRQHIADQLGVTAAEIQQPAVAILNRARTEAGLRAYERLLLPALDIPLPRLVATYQEPAPPRRRPGRPRLTANPFARRFE